MTTVVTKATGGSAKPVGVLYIEPDQQVPDAGSGTGGGTSATGPGTAPLWLRSMTESSPPNSFGT